MKKGGTPYNGNFFKRKIRTADHGLSGRKAGRRICTAEGNISQKYLESIATVLSKGHLIEAASGHKGGYHLSRKPEEYSIGEVLRMTEGSLAPVACLKEDAGHCDQADLCYTLPIWQGLADVINNYLDSISLKDVADSAQNMENSQDIPDKKEE